MTPEETAGLMGLEVQTLAAWRVLGKSPPYSKVGRKVFYSRRAVMAWLSERTFTSTAEARMALATA